MGSSSGLRPVSSGWKAAKKASGLGGARSTTPSRRHRTSVGVRRLASGRGHVIRLVQALGTHVLEAVLPETPGPSSFGQARIGIEWSTSSATLPVFTILNKRALHCHAYFEGLVCRHESHIAGCSATGRLSFILSNPQHLVFKRRGGLRYFKTWLLLLICDKSRQQNPYSIHMISLSYFAEHSWFCS